MYKRNFIYPPGLVTRALCLRENMKIELCYLLYNVCFAAWIYYDSFYRDMNRSAWASLTLLFGFIVVPAYFVKSREDNENYINLFKYFGLWLIGFILFSVVISGGTILKTINYENLLQLSSGAFLILLCYIIPKYFLNKSNEKLTTTIQNINDDTAKYVFSFKRVFKKITNDNDAIYIVRDVSLILLVYTLFMALGILVSGRLMKLPGICIILGLIFLLWKFSSRFAALLLLGSSLFTLLLTLLMNMKQLLGNTNLIKTIIDISILLFILWINIRATDATFKIHGLPLKSTKIYKFVYKAYFWVLVILLIPSILLARESNTFYIYLIIDFTVSIVSLIGLYGYVFQKHIFRPITWKIWLFIFVCWEVFYFYLTMMTVNIENPVGIYIVSCIMFLTLMLPLFIAIYLYGYKSDRLWDFKYKS